MGFGGSQAGVVSLYMSYQRWEGFEVPFLLKTYFASPGVPFWNRILVAFGLTTVTFASSWRQLKPNP